jgi:hypothetical protein
MQLRTTTDQTDITDTIPSFVLRHSEHSCHPWFAERFFTEGSKGNKEGNLEPFATFVFFCFPPGLEGNHGFGSGKWMQFRFSTEVNEGNKDVSGVLKKSFATFVFFCFPAGLVTRVEQP